MNEPNPSSGHEPTRDERLSALFAHLVMQQSNMAMMLMGKTPHPETGKPVRDFESAKLFIDLLEMLEAKTKGNLDKHEAGFLKQNLTALRMAFVEAADHERSAKPEKTVPETPTTAAAAEAPPQTESSGSDESRKKFSKKY